jgi:hypothetical protein
VTSISTAYRKDVARSLFLISRKRHHSSYMPTLLMVNDNERKRTMQVEHVYLFEWRSDLARSMTRLVAQCRGLIEVQTYGVECKLSGLQLTFWGDGRVVFSHRSISDYIKSGEACARLCQQAEWPSIQSLWELEFQTSAAVLHVVTNFFGCPTIFPGVAVESKR